MNMLNKAKAATDDEILGGLSDNWLFTFQVVSRVIGKQNKAAGPVFNAKLRKLEKIGMVVGFGLVRGQERWKLA